MYIYIYHTWKKVATSDAKDGKNYAKTRKKRRINERKMSPKKKVFLTIQKYKRGNFPFIFSSLVADFCRGML